MKRPYAEVIGDPIAHSKSPLIHNFWLAKLGIDADYRATHVRAEELGDYFTQRRSDAAWRGCNVTIPHKITVIGLLDNMVASASKVGAVNSVVASRSGLTGSNTDIDGIREAVGKDTWGHACVIGSGGAARAAIWHCANAEISGGPRRREVNIIARNLERSKLMLAEFDLDGRAFGFDAAEQGLAYCPLVINATSLGMSGQPALPRNVLTGLSHAYADATIFDMVYAPLETRLLTEARRLGMNAIDGLVMLIGQAAHTFQLFFGARAPREHDLELRALLTS